MWRCVRYAAVAGLGCWLAFAWISAARPVPDLALILAGPPHAESGGQLDFELGRERLDDELRELVVALAELVRRGGWGGGGTGAHSEWNSVDTVASLLLRTRPWRGTLRVENGGTWVAAVGFGGWGRVTPYWLSRLDGRTFEASGRRVHVRVVGLAVIAGSERERVEAAAREVIAVSKSEVPSGVRLRLAGDWPASNRDLLGPAGISDHGLCGPPMVAATFSHLHADEWRLTYELAASTGAPGLPLAWLEQEGVSIHPDDLPASSCDGQEPMRIAGLARCVRVLTRDLDYWANRRTLRGTR